MTHVLNRIPVAGEALRTFQEAQQSKQEVALLKGRLDDLEEHLDRMETAIEHHERLVAGDVEIEAADLATSPKGTLEDPMEFAASNAMSTLITQTLVSAKRIEVAASEGVAALVDRYPASPLDDALGEVLDHLELPVGSDGLDAVDELKAATEAWGEVTERCELGRGYKLNLTIAPTAAEVDAAAQRLDEAWEGLAAIGLGEHRLALLRAASAGTLSLDDAGAEDIDWFREFGLASALTITFGG